MNRACATDVRHYDYGHDYDPGWDYNVIVPNEYRCKRLNAIKNQMVPLDEFSFDDFDVYLVHGLIDTGYDSVGCYIDGTASHPVVIVSDSFFSPDPTYCDHELARTLLHELIHADRPDASEETVETMAGQYQENHSIGPPFVSANKLTNALQSLAGEWNMDPYNINDGHCVEFAETIAQRVDGIQTDSRSMNDLSVGHMWLMDDEHYYDAECTNGVSDWKDLPIFKRYRYQQKTGEWVRAIEDVPDEEIPDLPDTMDESRLSY